MTEFRMGTLDHVHVRVPDRAEAARWYSEHLGFEPVAEYDFWATGIDFGPLQISADGGRSMLALFEVEDYDASSRQHAGNRVLGRCGDLRGVRPVAVRRRDSG